MSSLVDDYRMLITGASGQVGNALRDVLPTAVFLTRSDLDLTDLGSIPRVIESHRPSAIINCAAYTNVDLAETEEGRATLVNGEAVGALADVCASLSIPLVTYSSDYVFDGRASMPYVESDPIGPVSAYGRSKALGEELALERHSGTIVVRTSWVVSATHDNFVSTMLRLADRGPFRVVDDQLGKPTIAADLAEATAAALRGGFSGIMHLANQGETTWYGLAAAVVRLAGFDPSLVDPCRTEDFPTPAARPKYSVLGTERSDTPLLPNWETSLPALVERQMERIRDRTRE